MRIFSTLDLNKQVGEVTNAAAQAPILITRHNKPRFVMMSVDHFESLRRNHDPRRAYGPGETPPDLAALFEAELELLSQGGAYDEKP